MTAASHRLDTAGEGTVGSRRSFKIYALLTVLLGIDLVLFGGWIADRAIALPVLARTMDFGLYAQGLGVATVAFGALIALTARRGGDWAALAPAMAGTAGAICVIAAIAGLSVLTPFGIALLLIVAAIDVTFMVLMRRALTG